MTPKTQPLEIDLDRSRSLRIRWADQHESVLPLEFLRRQCPCAECRSRRDERERSISGLPVVPGNADAAEMTIAITAELVGAYALRIRWKDGHDAGIYDFAELRAMDSTAP